jgi:capsular exopolysaccharide synthesis family protein
LIVQLSQYFQVVIRRKWTILITTVVAVIVVALLSIQAAPVYQATLRLRVVPFGGTARPDYSMLTYFDRLANTYSDILQSNLVTEKAKTQLGLEELPDFQISLISNTELMRLDVQAETPELAQQVANTLGNLLIEQNEVGTSNFTGELSSRLAEMQAEINTLNDELATLQNQVPRNNLRIAEVQRNIRSMEQNYNLTQAQLNQAMINQLAYASSLSILEPAPLPELPSNPSLMRNVVVGVGIGLMGGIALAFVMESLNPRLNSYRQIETVVGAPIVGKIPNIKRQFRNNVFMGDVASSEAFRRLRTNLFVEQENAPLSLLLVTSALPKEGNSTVSMNLALAMAHSGRRVLLVDGDILRPTIHKRFNLSNSVGLSDVLRGSTDFKSAVQKVPGVELDVLSAGPFIPNSSELLSSEATDKLLEVLLLHYEIVIIDGPATLAVTDSTVIAPHMNGVLWVVDQKRADQRAVTTALEHLKSVNAPVLGVVANRVARDQNIRYLSHYYSVSPNGKSGKSETRMKARVPELTNNHKGK